MMGRSRGRQTVEHLQTFQPVSSGYLTERAATRRQASCLSWLGAHPLQVPVDVVVRPARTLGHGTHGSTPLWGSPSVKSATFSFLIIYIARARRFLAL